MEEADETKPLRPVRLTRDDDRLRRALEGHDVKDVIVVALFLLDATEKKPKPLKQIYDAVWRIKPVSSFGNPVASLKQFGGYVRGYLNNDKHQEVDGLSFPFFSNPRKGSGLWGLSHNGEGRATRLLRLLGMSRG